MKIHSPHLALVLIASEHSGFSHVEPFLHICLAFLDTQADTLNPSVLHLTGLLHTWQSSFVHLLLPPVCITNDAA